MGEFANKGTEYQPAGEPERVSTHDFVDPQLGRAIPYEIYDTVNDEGWVSVGDTADTAEFAVESIRSTNQLGAGCSCAAHASVRTLLGAAIEDQADLALIDMEAGLEHLSRSGGTLAHADVLLMVMEPSRKSVLTAARTMALAEELGIRRLAGVGNKASLPEDNTFFAEVCAEYGVPLAGVVPFDDEVASADRLGKRLRPPSGVVREAVETIVDFVESPEAQRAALLAERARIDSRLAVLTAVR